LFLTKSGLHAHQNKATGSSYEELEKVIEDPTISSETHPVKYMLKVNKKLKAVTGFYFVDD
jgi:hypothetical protein